MEYTSLFDDSIAKDVNPEFDADLLPNSEQSDKNLREFSRWLFYKAFEVALDRFAHSLISKLLRLHTFFELFPFYAIAKGYRDMFAC